MSSRRPDETFEEYRARRKAENDYNKIRTKCGVPVDIGRNIYWLSFAEDFPPHGRGNLGVIIARGNDAEDAIAKITIKGMNPGGLVNAVHLRQKDYKKIKKYMNRLLTEDELNKAGLL